MSKMLEITPSLFFQYAKSPHWIWYDLHGDPSQKTELPELTKKLIEGGILHEEEYVRNIIKVAIDKSLPEQEAENQTLQYMNQGVDLIYQGAISYVDRCVKYKGRPDLLRKCDGYSNFGNYYYIPIEIKNSTKCEVLAYKKQLMFYAIILEKIQGYMPLIGIFINKNKEEIECELNDKLLEKTKESISLILDILRGTEPPIKISSECKQTPWFDVLLNEAKTKNDIALIYKMRSDSLENLRQVGLKTIQDVANCNLNSLAKIKGASIDTLRRVQLQAKALINNEVIPLNKSIIPNAKTKIYFDIESDPLLKVEYLFGLLIVKENNSTIFKYFLSERPEDENQMWSKFLVWLNEQEIRDSKIYHYHNYEKTSLSKLTKKYGGSEKLDFFIKNLVDISKIIEQSFIFPIYFYSIKDIAKYLDFEWQHEKAGGAQSIFWYEKWLETGNRNTLQDIINYNEDDVRATEFLHNWLLEKVKSW